MSKNTDISELINYVSVNGSGHVVFTTVPSAASNTDKFLVSDSGALKFRTAAQLLSDIGAQASGNYQTALTNPVTGTGTANYLPKFIGSTSIANSLIFDNGTNVLIGTTTAPTPVAGVSFPLSVTSSAVTRIRIDSTQATPNSGFGLYANSVQKWSIAMFGTGSDFTIYNDALLASAILVKGASSNVLVGYGTSTADAGFKLDVNGTGRFSSSSSVKLTLSGGTNQNGIVYSAVSSAPQYYLGSGSGLLGGDFGFIILDVADNRGVLYDNKSTGELRLTAPTFQSFYVNSSSRMAIFNDGNVSISNSPSNAGFKLDVNGTGRFSGNVTAVGGIINGSDFRYNPAGNTSGNPVLVLKNPSTGVLSIASEIIGDANVNSNSLALSVSNATNGRFNALTIASTGAATFTNDVTANRYRGINSLVLNTYTTVNPSSNVYLYSPLGDRDAWIYLDSADTGSNWGIYHRQIDTAVAGLPANSIGFIGGGSSTLQGWISLATGQATFNNNIAATSTGVDGTFADAFVGRYNANNNETNAIQTAVSSAASGSGFRFQASNGGGSTGRTTVVDFLRDRQIFYGNIGIGTPSPVNKFHLEGGKFIMTSNDGGYGQFQINAPAGGEATILLGSTGSGQNNGGYTNVGVMGMGAYGNNRDTLVLGTGYNAGTIFLKNNNALIGTATDGGYRLDVAGQIRSFSATPLVLAMTSNGANDAIVAARWTSGVGMEMRYFPDFALGYIDNTYPIVSGQVFGDIHLRQNISGTMTSRVVLKAITGNLQHQMANKALTFVQLTSVVTKTFTTSGEATGTFAVTDFSGIPSNAKAVQVYGWYHITGYSVGSGQGDHAVSWFGIYNDGSPYSWSGPAAPWPGSNSSFVSASYGSFVMEHDGDASTTGANINYYGSWHQGIIHVNSSGNIAYRLASGISGGTHYNALYATGYWI
jgi:hypothetical protein